MDRRTVLAAALICACGFLASAACVAGEDAPPHEGALAIGVHPANSGTVCFTLTDPSGRAMSAGPPCEAHELSEIPDAYHDYESIDDDETGAPGPVTRVIFLRSPLPGVYVLDIMLPEDDGFDLEVQGSDGIGGTSHRLITGIDIEPGEMVEYSITWKDTPAAEVTVERRGGEE